MTHKSSFTPLATALACALLAGCNLAPQDQAPPLPVPETVAPPLPPDSRAQASAVARGVKELLCVMRRSPGGRGGFGPRRPGAHGS